MELGSGSQTAGMATVGRLQAIGRGGTDEAENRGSGGGRRHTGDRAERKTREREGEREAYFF